jgi:hypothetical protein
VPAEQQDDTLGIIGEKKRRLYFLELSAARQGYDTSPQISMVIEDLKSEIQTLERDASAEIAGMGRPATVLTGGPSVSPSPLSGEMTGVVESPAPLPHSRNAFFSGREDLLVSPLTIPAMNSGACYADD